MATTGDKIVAQVDPEKCTGCKECTTVCTSGAMMVIDDEAWVDTSKCRGCGKCAEVCPNGAITVGLLSQLNAARR